MNAALWLTAGALIGALWVSWINRWRRGGRQALAIGLFIAAAIYVGFAVGSGSGRWLLVESSGALACGFIGWLGVRGSALWLASGWGLHPLWDIGLHLYGPGAAIAPAWYALACLSFDLVVAAFVLLQWARLGHHEQSL